MESSLFDDDPWTPSSPPEDPVLPMTCSEYIDLVVHLVRASLETRNVSTNRVSANSTFIQSQFNAFQSSKQFLNNIASPAVCVFGVVGNILNLIVLTRKQLQRSMDRMERSVSVGLVALAASDMVFCLLYMIATLVPERSLYTPHEIGLTLYFKIYQEGLVNVFMLSSTWLTVNMALGRYVAICHPLHARGFINLRATRVAVACIFLASVIVSLPRFWHFYARHVPCETLVDLSSSSSSPIASSMTATDRDALVESCACAYRTKEVTALYAANSAWFVFGHGLLCSVLAVFVPLVVLTVCNVCLVRALRRSYRMQTMYRANKPKESGHRITPTLIAIIVLFIILVTPADLLNFARLTTDHLNYKVFEAASVITNFMLTINFAVNFVLYCVVNAQFRKTARNVLFCRWRGYGRADGMGASEAGGGEATGSGGNVRNGRHVRGSGVGGARTSYTCNFSETEMMPTSMYAGAQRRGSDSPI